MTAQDQDKIKKDEIIVKTTLLYGIVLIMAFGIFFRLVQLNFFQKSKWEAVAKEYSINLRKGEPQRGDIYDENGNILSSSVYYFDVFMDTYAAGIKTDEAFSKDIDSLAFYLSKHFKDRTAQEYLKYLKKGRADKNRYLHIAPMCNYKDISALDTFPVFKKGPNGGGFIVLKKGHRIRPMGSILRRTIGLVEIDNNTEVVYGQTGLELTYNSELTGTPGKVMKRKISKGIWMEIPGTEIVKTKDGMSLVTSIDIDLQDYVNQVLKEKILETRADHGVVIVMEVKTGNIKAIANLTLQKDSTVFEDQNYAVAESLEPGSTFKLPVLMAAFEDGLLDVNDTFDTGRGYVKYYDKEIRDEGAYGEIPVWKIFAKSSNVGMAKIVYELYAKNNQSIKFTNRLHAFGLSDYSGIDIDGEVFPLIKDHTNKKWSKVSPMMISHGYEVQQSPINILTFYNAVANNGKMVKPSIVKALTLHGETVKVYTNKIEKIICSKETISKAQFILKKVMEEGGTGHNIITSGYSIAGKTGTVKYYDHIKQTYIDQNRTSFVGYFPADNPKYSCIVVINRPKGGGMFGSNVAAPVFKKIADKIYSKDAEINPPENKDLKGMNSIDIPISKNGYKADLDYVFASLSVQTQNKDTAQQQWVFTKTNKYSVEYKNQSFYKNIVPNVKFMGASDAVYLLESMGLIVEVKGRGFVQSQSIAPGTKFRAGNKIKIVLI